jgi:pentatricopeptide repeat protein
MKRYYDLMLENGKAAPNVKTFNVILDAFARKGDTKNILNWIRELKVKNFCLIS